MISCHRAHLEARCRERGYTLDEVMGCVFSQDGDEWTIDTESEFYPRTPKPVFEPAPPPALEPMPQRGPGFLEKVRNFAVAAAGHVAAGMPRCSDEEIIRRHDICLACEHLQDGACTQCGCPISRVAGYVSKLSWAGEECPVGKWGKAPAASAQSAAQ